MGSRTRAMKLTPRDLASASTIILALLVSAASAQHATESLTSEGQYTVEAAADPGYYTGQYQHQHQAQDFYSGGRLRARPSTTITKSADWTRRWWTRSWRRWRARTTAANHLLPGPGTSSVVNSRHFRD